MNVKTKDKIATGVFYAIAVLIVIILAGLLGYILVKGVPQLSWKFLMTPPQSFQLAAESVRKFGIHFICSLSR